MRAKTMKALILLLAASTAFGATTRSPLSKISPANKKLYAEVRDAKDWRNPYLVVGASDVQVLHVGNTTAEQLKTFLEKLPKKAWPYGRVVALSEQGIRSGNDDKLIKENLEKVLAASKAEKIKVELWPSA